MNLDQAMELWFHYEEIAMHFNELIIQYRLQLMGGVGVIGALSGFLIGDKVKDPKVSLALRAWVSFGLLILLVASACLDIFYYNELLRGSVQALIELESKYKEINLSTTIKNRFEGGASWRIWSVYTLVVTTLLIFTAWSWDEYKNRSFKWRIFFVILTIAFYFIFICLFKNIA